MKNDAEIRQSSQAADHAPQPDLKTGPGSDALSPEPSTPVLDPDWLAGMEAKRPEFLRRMFAIFIREEPKRLAETGEAVAAGDAERTGFLAHSHKGACSTLGAPAARDAAAALEQAGKQARMAEATDLYAVFRRELERVFEAMQAYLDANGGAPE